MPQGYSIDSIGNDAYFRAAYQSYNPMFQAAQAQAQQQYQQYVTQQNDTTRVASSRSSSSANSSIENLPKADYSEKSITPWVVGGLALATAAGYCIYKKKSPWGIIKEWGGKIKNAVSSGNAEGVTNELKAVVKDGQVSFLVPGKTVTKTDTASITALAHEYGIDISELTKLTKGNLKSLDGGVFLMDGNKIRFKGDKIIEILNGKNENITEQILKKATVDDKAFAGRIEDFIKNARKLEKGWAKDLLETSVTTQVGDNVLQVTRTGARVAEQATDASGNQIWQVVKQKATPSMSLTRFETLERLGADSEPVLNFYRNNPSFKNIFTSKDFAAGKYLTGTDIESALIESSDFAGKKLKFNNGKFVGFYEGGKYYAESSEHFGAFLETGENKANLEKLYKNTFKDGKIPSTGVQVVLRKS